MAKSKKKYYAVAAGQEPGIYETWSGPGGAQAQVSGFPGARYKGFFTRGEAEMWLKQGGVPGKNTSKKTGSKDNKNNGASVDIQKELDKGHVVLYTDGGCLNNPGPGGYGAVLIRGEQRRELSAGFRRTTNNRMELTACIEGLKAIKKPAKVILFSDSQYVVNGITKGWARRWKQKGWMRRVDQLAENYDLWDQLLEQCDIHDVTFSWVRGHTGNEGNERCDQLAGQASTDTDNHQQDTAYETDKTTVQKQATLF